MSPFLHHPNVLVSGFALPVVTVIRPVLLSHTFVRKDGRHTSIPFSKETIQHSSIGRLSRSTSSCVTHDLVDHDKKQCMVRVIFALCSLLHTHTFSFIRQDFTRSTLDGCLIFHGA